MIENVHKEIVRGFRAGLYRIGYVQDILFRLSSAWAFAQPEHCEHLGSKLDSWQNRQLRICKALEPR